MIAITGATGNLGSSVVAQLLKLLAADQFIVTSSNAEGVDKLKAKGLQARVANFNDPSSLADVFKGVSKVLLISTMDQNRLQQHKNVVIAAKGQGVQHLVYTGIALRDIQSSGVKEIMQSHFETEAYIKASGLAYTFLRNTMYAEALVQILGTNALQQNINLPGGTAKVPYALRSELGEATANLLVQEGHENKTYELVGDSSYGYAEIAAALSNYSANTIHYHPISEVAFKTLLKQQAFPDFAIYLHSGTLYDIKTQQYEIENKQLATLLGRPTATLNNMIAALFLPAT